MPASRETSEGVDPLTGFGNRRRLVEDLAGALRPTAPPALFALFDLGGYDDYLGFYGQLQVEALITRLARRFSKKLEAAGTCFRPRRDEFAALLHTSIDQAHPVLDSALAALHTRDRERGAGIVPAFGAVLLPDEADDVTGVMMLADERLALTAPARPPRERRRNRRRPRASTSPRQTSRAGPPGA